MGKGRIGGNSGASNLRRTEQRTTQNNNRTANNNTRNAQNNTKPKDTTPSRAQSSANDNNSVFKQNGAAANNELNFNNQQNTSASNDNKNDTSLDLNRNLNDKNVTGEQIDDEVSQEYLDAESKYNKSSEEANNENNSEQQAQGDKKDNNDDNQNLNSYKGDYLKVVDYISGGMFSKIINLAGQAVNTADAIYMPDDNNFDTAKNYIDAMNPQGSKDKLGNIAQNLNTASNLAEQVVNGVDAVYKPNEDNFGGADNFINNIKTAGRLLSIMDNATGIVAESGTALSNLAGQYFNPDNIKSSLQNTDFSADFKTIATQFIKGLFNDKTLEMLNFSLQKEPTGTVSDADLSPTEQYNGLTNKDMLILSNLSNTDFINLENNGKTLGEIVNGFKDALLETGEEGYIDENGDFTAEGVKYIQDNGFGLGTQDFEVFRDMLNDIKNNEELSTLTILDNADQKENYMYATTYGHLDENGMLKDNATVIFKGTCNATGWADNAESLAQNETQMQVAAYEYIKRQEGLLKDISPDPNNVHISVAGHSKGGNMSMYTTIRNGQDILNGNTGITIDNCISFDGQGFNSEFINKYNDAIEENKDKITSISSCLDPINSLLGSVAGTVWNVDSAVTGCPQDENGNMSFSDLSQLGELFWDAHSPSNIYKAINTNDGNDEWTTCEKTQFSSIIGEISNSIQGVSQSDREFIAQLLVDVFVNAFAGGGEVRGDDAEKLSEPVHVEEYDIDVVKTTEGYNVYDSSVDSGNTIATFSPDFTLTSGTLKPYVDDTSEEDATKTIASAVDDELYNNA